MEPRAAGKPQQVASSWVSLVAAALCYTAAAQSAKEEGAGLALLQHLGAARAAHDALQPQRIILAEQDGHCGRGGNRQAGLGWDC